MASSSASIRSSKRSFVGIFDQAGAAQAQGHAGLLDRRMGLRRGVDPQRGNVRAGPGRPLAAASIPAAWRAAARASIDDVDAVSVSRPSNSAGSPRRLAQPVDDDLLQLRAGRARPPQHRVGVEDGRQHLADDPGPGRGAGEVGQEARVLPVSDVRLEQTPVVRQDRLDRLGRFGRRAGKSGRSDPARSCGMTSPVADAVEVVGHDVDRRVRGRPEVLGIHVAQAGAADRPAQPLSSIRWESSRASGNHSSLVRLTRIRPRTRAMDQRRVYPGSRASGGSGRRAVPRGREQTDTGRLVRDGRGGAISNARPPEPHSGALPGCATPRRPTG